MVIDELAIDIETYSSVDLTKSGVYAYSDAPDFETLLFAYAFNDDPVEIIDLASLEELPEKVLDALLSEDVLKTAYNANFERTCLASELGLAMPASQWQCTAVWSRMAGLPGNLADTAKVLGLPEDKQKMKIGKELIKYFTMPCRATKTNGQRLRNYPHHDTDKWELFKEYCKQDVVTEMAIKQELKKRYPITSFERRIWILDQDINDRGILVDETLVNRAIELDSVNKEMIEKEMITLTNIENPNSATQIKEWLYQQGTDTDKLRKEDVSNLITNTTDDIVKKVLELRQSLAKTSIKKYQAMQLTSQTFDGRAHGTMLLYGASRTGRWAGRLIQPQNMPRNYLSDNDLELARQLVKQGDLGGLEVVFGNVSDTLSQLTRTALIAKPGHTFIIADFSAIEARVIAWLADEQWRNEVFASHGKIYEASAAQMFKIPIEQVNKELRARGKVAELALGYQGGAGALIAMGALDKGLTEEELPGVVSKWRLANRRIVELWSTVEQAAKEALTNKRVVRIKHGISFIPKMEALYIELPSGRRLSYVKARLINKKIKHSGTDQIKGTWTEDIDTYGGKLVENIVQAIARDCLAEAMLKIDAVNLDIVMHVHDEIIVEAPKIVNIERVLADMLNVMKEPIEWAPGLKLKAEGFITDFYKKDTD